MLIEKKVILFLFWGVTDINGRYTYSNLVL